MGEEQGQGGPRWSTRRSSPRCSRRTGIPSQAAPRRSVATAVDGEDAARAGDRPGRGGGCGGEGRPAQPPRPQGPQAADGLVHVPAGPTGVGKTELAKALAEFLFDDEVGDDLAPAGVRRSTVLAPVGAPPGFVGTRRVANSPRRCGGGRAPWCCWTRSRRRRSSTPAADAGGGAPDRRAGARRLQEHRHHHDDEPRTEGHPGGPVGFTVEGDSRTGYDLMLREGGTGAEEALQARVPQPRRRHRLPAAG